MTWYSSVATVTDDRFPGVMQNAWAPWPPVRSLGSSIAGPWRWEDERHASASERPERMTPSKPAGVRLSAPPEILRHMARAARALGRSESAIWVEAAREWLLRHEPEDPTGGHESGGRAVAPDADPMRRTRAWRDIDQVLAILRDDARFAERDRVPA